MSLAQALIAYAQSGGNNSGALLRALAHPHNQQPREPRPNGPGGYGGEGGGKGESTVPTGRTGNAPQGFQGGKTYILPTSWTGTHVTDGLGWGTKTAEDIMLSAGTPLGAPEAGRIAYYHPNGAQGGGSEMFYPAGGGHPWWLGHLDAGYVGPVKRGQYIGRVSSRHPRPHVHIDRGLQ